MSQDLRPEEGGTMSRGHRYLRAAVAALIILGGMALTVWYTNR